MIRRIPIMIPIIGMLLFAGLAWCNHTLPREFGKSVPVFQGAEPLETRYTRDSVKTVFAMGASPEEVVDFYRAGLKRRGWRILSAGMGEREPYPRLRAIKVSVLFSLRFEPGNGKRKIVLVIELKYPRGRE